MLVVLPQASRLLSRELAYTALTRARQKLVLLIEGDDPGVLLDLTRAERSETARRNTNLFDVTAVRRPGEEQPFAEHLRHRASDGTLVRSKSELAILNRILERFGAGVFEYEQRLPGGVTGGRLLPDFTAVTDSGDSIVLEHLGMLDVPSYQASWAWKLRWYEANGFVLGENAVHHRRTRRSVHGRCRCGARPDCTTRRARAATGCAWPSRTTPRSRRRARDRPPADRRPRHPGTDRGRSAEPVPGRRPRDSVRGGPPGRHLGGARGGGRSPPPWRSVRPGLMLSINVSLDGLATAPVRDALSGDLTGVILEITEHTDIEPTPRLTDEVQSLRDRGAIIAVDDWGKGFSNLDRVLLLRPEIVKIDMSLVHNLDLDYHRAAIQTVCAWADLVGARICAEGVETEEQWRQLQGHRSPSRPGLVLRRARRARARPSPPGRDARRRRPGAVV